MQTKTSKKRHPSQRAKALPRAESEERRDLSTEKVFLSFKNRKGTEFVLGTSFAFVLIFVVVAAFGGSTIRPAAELLLLIKGSSSVAHPFIAPIKKLLGL